MGRSAGKLSWLRACSTSGCRPRANMATASVVLHVFTTLNTLSSAKTKHANEQRGTRASQSHTVQAGERATQTARRAEQRGVFRFPWLPNSARGQYGYSMGRFALPKCAACPCQLRENGCPFRERGRACGGRRSRVPTGAAVRLPSHWKRRYRPPRVPTRASEWRDDVVLHEGLDVKGAGVVEAGEERVGTREDAGWCSRGPTRASV